LTLRAISKEMGELPSSLRRVFDALADPDPALRMSSAAEASNELKKLQGQFQAAERETDLPSAMPPQENDTWPEGKMVAVNPKDARAKAAVLPLASMRPVVSEDTGMMKSPVGAD